MNVFTKNNTFYSKRLSIITTKLLYFTVVFYLTYGISSYISQSLPWRFSIALSLDHKIPFYPSWSLIYLSMPLLVVYSAYAISDLERFSKLIKIMTIQCIIAMGIFLLFPIESISEPPLVKSYSMYAYQLADALNLELNYLPSLHVTFSVTTAYYLKEYCKEIKIKLIYVWVTAICLSTLFIHTHYIVDVISGILFALASIKLATIFQFTDYGK